MRVPLWLVHDFWMLELLNRMPKQEIYGQLANCRQPGSNPRQIVGGQVVTSFSMESDPDHRRRSGRSSLARFRLCLALSGGFLRVGYYVDPLLIR